jgi:SAM-dependent methyltransferase
MNPNTDSEWERWGQREPYFGVITDARFRRHALTTESRKEFFDSGFAHVDYVLQMIRLHIWPEFRPTRVLDFGCGVGRTLVPFAKLADNAVGVDVAPSMLEEARANCRDFGVRNVALELSDDDLSRVHGQFDLVHSFIVFQHIAAERGKPLFARLLERIAPGGNGALHVLYSKSAYATSFGVAPKSDAAPIVARETDVDPEMQMNAYGATELFFMLQRHGVHRVHAEFTDHGGELGLFLFFRAPA